MVLNLSVPIESLKNVHTYFIVCVRILLLMNFSCSALKFSYKGINFKVVDNFLKSWEKPRIGFQE